MIPHQQQLWKFCLGIMARVVKAVLVGERSKGRDEGIHAVKKRSEL
jgi:hypothetical protein